MREYVTQAIILDREPQGEFDARLTLWSRKFGKMRARAVSLRKITSKLSAHLEPGMLSEVRLVENRNLQIVDAVKIRRIPVPPLEIARFGRLLSEGELDDRLWMAATAAEWSWSAILGALGWDPRGAECFSCGRGPEAFSASNQDFFCFACAVKMPADTLIYIDNVAL